MRKINRARGIDVVLVLVSIVWGSTFLVAKDALAQVSPFTFLALRLGIGALVLGLVFHRRLLRITRAELRGGGLIGLFLFAAYSLQTVGLQYTTVSKSGFITGLYVPLVPLFAVFVLRQWPTRLAAVAVAMSAIGLTLLSITDDFNFDFGLGEFLTLGGAIAATLHIVSVSRFAPRADPLNLAAVQIAVTAALSIVAVPLAGEPVVLPQGSVLWAALFLGVIATAFAIGVMNWAQQFMSSTRATLIYALEPVWAGIFGVAFAGDVLTAPALVGCALIVGGMVVGGLGKNHRA